MSGIEEQDKMSGLEEQDTIPSLDRRDTYSYALDDRMFGTLLFMISIFVLTSIVMFILYSGYYIMFGILVNANMILIPYGIELVIAFLLGFYAYFDHKNKSKEKNPFRSAWDFIKAMWHYAIGRQYN